MKQNSLIELLLTSTVMAMLLAANGAKAQSTLIPVPFGSVAAGIPAGTTTTQCPSSADIPNAAGYHFGDGCPATQAVMATHYDVEVDQGGNLYVGENGSSHFDLRVVYNGGATLRNLLIAASPSIANFSPKLGYMYTLAGGLTGTLTSHSGLYYCGNITTNGIQALDNQGNGCPAAMAYVTPKGIFIDQYGNVFFANVAGKNNNRVVYAGGAAVAKLIELENPLVTKPQVGYVYDVVGGGATGPQGDGGLSTSAGMMSPRFVYVDPQSNIYSSDGNQAVASTVLASPGNYYYVDGSVNNIRVTSSTTGLISVFAGETNCAMQPGSATDPSGGFVSAAGCPFAVSYPPIPPSVYPSSIGDGGPATLAQFDGPYGVFADGYGNIYVMDIGNSRLRVVYKGGTIPGISNPQVGYIYTYMGGGSVVGAQDVLAQNVKLSASVAQVAGIDKTGNLYVQDTTGSLYKFDAITSVGNIITGGNGALSYTTGVYCNGDSAGPVATDKWGDGCPGAELNFSALGDVSNDRKGDIYVGTNGRAYIDHLSYNTTFPTTAVGGAVTQPIAVTATAALTLTGLNFTLNGSPTTEFSDAGGDTCTTTQAMTAGQICVFYVKFTPAHSGLRNGTVTITTTSTTSTVVEAISGVGTSALLAVDPGTVSNIGTGIVPGGVATDLLGSVYVADTSGNRVLKGSATGTTLTPLIPTGLSKPSQIAVDGAGNVYVADTGNNRILETTSAGVTVASLGTGLSGPKGVVVDGAGNIYVADTGNNRIVVLHTNGYQSTLLEASGLSSPAQLALDSSNDLFIVDTGNQRLAEYIPGAGISTFTVDPGVVAAGVAVDSAGDVFIEDSSSLNVINYPGGAVPGNILVGNLIAPVALAGDPDSNLFIADAANTFVEEYRRSVGNIQFPYTDLAGTSVESITLTNVGNAPLTFRTPPSATTGTNASLFTVSPSSTNGCTVATPYVASATCNFMASFTPGGTPVNATATVAFATNAGNTATAHLAAQGVHLTTTTTALNLSSATGNTVYYSQSVTLTATLTPSTVTTTPSGAYTFTVDGKTQKPQTLGAGSTSYLTLALPVGTHTVSVTYSGDITYASSAQTVTFTVNKAVTTTALTAVPVNNSGSLTLQFTATVSVNNNTATLESNFGTVTFYAGAVALNATATPITCATTCTATYNSPLLTFASNTLTAVYSGNANFASSTSAAVNTNGGDFAVGSSSAPFTIPQGKTGQAAVTLESLFGGAGTITPSCAGLPANSVCRFLPVFPSLTSGETQTVSIQVFTNTPSNLASNGNSGFRGVSILMCGLPLGLGLLLFRKHTLMGRVLMLGIALMLMSGLTGCGTPLQTFSDLVTPTGTYSITITFQGSAGLTTTHTSTLNLVIVSPN
jgi:hypothetical protein